MKRLAALRATLAESDWLRILLGFAGVVGLGILLGHQYVFPDKRVLAVAAAVIIFGIAWRVDLVTAIGLLLVVIPFPRYTVFGSTTIAFVLLLAIVWLLRASQRETPGLRGNAATASNR